MAMQQYLTLAPRLAQRPLSAGTYVHWGVVQIGLTNLVIIGVMVLVFLLALFIPFGRAEVDDVAEREYPESES